MLSTARDRLVYQSTLAGEHDSSRATAHRWTSSLAAIHQLRPLVAPVSAPEFTRIGNQLLDAELALISAKDPNAPLEPWFDQIDAFDESLRSTHLAGLDRENAYLGSRCWCVRTVVEAGRGLQPSLPSAGYWSDQLSVSDGGNQLPDPRPSNGFGE